MAPPAVRRQLHRVLIESLESRSLLATDLLLDSRPQDLALSSTPDNMVLIGGTTYFTATGDGIGAELWKTDGTASGTVLVKDVRVGSVGSQPNQLTNVSGTLFFRANDGVNGVSLWKTSAASGPELVKAGTSSIDSLTNLNGTLYFFFGSNLWKSDGTQAGSILVKFFESLATPSFVTNVNGKLFFSRIASFNTQDVELWTSDGTTEGTVVVKDIQPGVAGSNPGPFTNVNGLAYFPATTAANGTELWKSDGTAAGTVLVKDINLTPNSGSSSMPSNLVNVNGTLYFSATNSTHGVELWKSDGSDAGTVMVKDIRVGAASSSPGSFINANGVLYFQAVDDSTGTELWKSNGTTSETFMVTEILAGISNPLIQELTFHDDSLYFFANDGVSGSELWKSDGTAAGTSLLKDIYPGAFGSGSSPKIWSNGSRVFIRANDGSTGLELWQSDGTAAGTSLVKNIRKATDDADPGELTNLNGSLLFSAGGNLWSSDGTSSGTSVLTSGTGKYLTHVQGHVFFRTGDNLRRTDGTAAGTVSIQSSSKPTELTEVNGTLFYAAEQSSTGRELWKVSGVSESLVKNINSNAGSSNPVELTNVQGTLFFSATTSANGAELWRSDGTDAGTVMVKDITVGAGGAAPSNLINVNGTLYFTANDGSYGTELWKSDGTREGTVLIKDIFAGPTGSNPTQLTNFNGVLFFAASTSTNGIELWRSDGTAAGTVLVKDILPGATSANPQSLVAIDNTLFFVATDSANGTEVWKSHGTSATTQLLRDIFPGVVSSTPSSLANIAGWLVFQANDGTSGEELWISDGSLSRTKLLDEVIPGSAGSNPTNFFRFGSQIFFSAYGESVGRELWKVAGPPAGTYIDSDQLLMNSSQISNSAALNFILTSGAVQVISPTPNTTIFDSNSAFSISRVQGLELTAAPDKAEQLTIDHSSGLINLPQGIRFGGTEGGLDTLSVTALSNMDVTLSQNSTDLIVDSFTAAGGVEVSFMGATQVSITGARRIATSGSLELDFPLNVNHQLPLELGSVTVLMGSTLTSSGTVALGTGKSLLGSGSVAGRIAAEAGSLMLANGNLTLGNVTSVIGFQTRGELETGGATVTLLDANQAVLGALTTLGNASQPGTLVAANGALIDFGNNLAGYGTIQTPNNASKVLMINGAAEGRSLSQPLTLTGFVKGMGSLNNVTITGTYSPGLSPAAVSLGSIAYASSATTLIELASTVPGSGYDQLNHSGQAVLNGILKVELLDGFQPAIGDAFTFLTATNSISGSFASVQLPALASGRQWQLNYGPNAIILSVIAANVAPTDIALSNALINENRPTNSLVGLLSTADPNAMETFTYTLVAGVGDAGNSSFTIAGNQLRTHAVFNFEQQADYPIRVRTVDSGGLIFEKALVIHVADLPELSGNPLVGNGTQQRSMISQVSMAFDGNIDIASGAFSLIKRGGGGPVTLQTPSIAQVNNQTLVTLTFTGALTRGPQSALVDGFYELIVDGSKITRGGTQLDVNGDGVAGGVYRFGDEEADAFFALFGDANGDGLVGVVEFGQFRSAFGKLPGDTGYNVLFDYDGLGVGVADFGQFRNRFGKPKLVWN